MSNHQKDTYIVNRNPSAFDDESGGEIVSFPRSVQDKLDRAQALLRQDRPAEALSEMRRAGTELARTSPELFVLAVASQMGVRHLAFEESEVDTRTVRTERYVMGFRYGYDETTTTNTRAKRRSIGMD